MPAHSKRDDRDIMTQVSPYASVSGTLARLREKGLEEFALIDHGGAAERTGLKVQETKLLVFGSPRAGTPLMVASPLLALDLPLKVLVWRDRDGRVLVSYNATSYLARRHNVPEDLVGNIAGIDALVESAPGEV